MISIHAPREGSDGETCAAGSPPANFYPRSPRGERQLTDAQNGGLPLFLSTLPARGATVAPSPTPSVRPANFYPRSPRGERRTQVERRLADLEISIHAPREGSDLWGYWKNNSWTLISIHAPREGSDGSIRPAQTARLDFYPRSPRGERRRRAST